MTDASEYIHKGVISILVPVLKGDAGLIKILREKLYSEDFSDLTVVNFSDVSQSCNTYDVYIQKAGTTRKEDHTYLGIAIYGAKKEVNRLTGSIPLLR